MNSLSCHTNGENLSFVVIYLTYFVSGLENHDSGVGIYAPDAESYSVFADLFDPIIEDYHAGFKKTDKHPPKNWGDVETLTDVDPTVSGGLLHSVAETSVFILHLTMPCF